MNQLPSSFYVWFPVTPHDYTPIYFSLNYIYNIYLNNAFFEKMRSEPKINGLGHILKYLHVRDHFSNSETPTFNTDFAHLEEKLKSLHLVPKLTEAAFYPKAKRQGLPSEDEIWLPSERFFWKYPQLNQGSSRHILMHTFQLKGSGRNPMATREDYHHSWGGQYFWQNLKALAFSRTFQGAFPLGVLDTLAFSIETQERIDSQMIRADMNSVLFREATGLRLTQIMTEFDPLQRPNKEDLKIKFQSESQNLNRPFPEAYYFHYAFMLIMGINDLNITKENLMLNGALIDYEDIDYLGTKSEQSLIITLKVVDAKNITKDSSLDELGEQVYLFSSNFHLYLSAMELTLECVEPLLDLKPSNSEASRNAFIQMLEMIGQKIYHIDESFLDLIHSLSTLQGSYIGGLHHFGRNGSDARNLIEVIKKYKYQITRIDLENTNSDLVEIKIDFPRGKWLHPQVDAYAQHIQVQSIEEKCTYLLRSLQLVTAASKTFNFKDCLEFSSKADKYLSAGAWINPYTLGASGISFHKSRLQDVSSELLKNIQFKDYAFNSFSGVLIQDQKCESVNLTAKELEAKLASDYEFVLRGFSINFEDIQAHFISVKPTWISHDSKMIT